MKHHYASLAYAQAFAPPYELLHLPQSEMYVLKRLIPGTEYYDAMGCYPVVPLVNAEAMASDMEMLKLQDIVSLVLVADSFFCPPEKTLRGMFDHVLAYKEHYLHDFSLARNDNSHHRYEIRQALKQCDVRVIALKDHLDTWCALYRTLIEKRGITGMQAFSRDYFASLAEMDMVMIGAFSNGVLVSAHLWFEYQGYVYSHLAASSEDGYKLRAPYAVYDYSIEYFAGKHAKLLDFGGGADAGQVGEGLTRFKKGFSNKSSMCFLCGKILDQELYQKLSAGKTGSYFPIYRS